MFINAAKAGDCIARSDWTSSATHLHVGTGHKALGNHTHPDMNAIQVFRDDFLLTNTRRNFASLDFIPNADRDSPERRGLNTIFSGDSTVDYPQDFLFFPESPTILFTEDNTATDGDYHYSWDNEPWFAGSTGGGNIEVFRRTVCFFPNAGGIIIIFDRIETTVAADVMLQFASVHDAALSGNSFVVDNGTSSCEVSLLSHPLIDFTKIDRAAVDTGYSNSIGDGAWTMRAAVTASSAAESVVSAIDINGAATTISYAVGGAGEHTVTVDFADATPTKTITFYDSGARRSIV